MSEDFEAVSRLVTDYAVAFHAGDTAGLRHMFQDGCILRTSREGTIAEFALAAWLDHVDGRPSPASQGHPLDFRLRGIDFAGQYCASAVVEMTVPATHFVDCLHLLRAEGGWRIVGKVFQATPR